MLLLAKIENHQFDESETVSLSELTAQSLERLQEHFSNKELSVQTETETGISVLGNKVLIEILINNLLLNAIRHNSHQGIVKLSLTKSGLTVTNSGIAALDRSSIFRRFKKSSSETSGSGLGLAIIEQICRRHHWTITYHFRQGLHVFEIDFKSIQNFF